MVAIVDEYFFRIVSANLKKNDDKIPWKALFNTRRNVTPLNPVRMVLGDMPPKNIITRRPARLKHAPKKYKKKFCSKTDVSMWRLRANSLYTEASEGMVMDPRVYSTAAGAKTSGPPGAGLQ